MKIVAVTNCPTGIAHTYMAAEALERAAADAKVDIKVETQGSIGPQNVLTASEIDSANVVLVATGVTLDMSRFAGKPVVEFPVNRVISQADDAIRQALAVGAATTSGTSSSPLSTPSASDEVPGISVAGRRGIARHLLTGISYMIPFTATGGLLIALSFLWGLDPAEGSFGATLNSLGGAALTLMVPIFAAFLAYSVADRPAIAPGAILGYVCTQIVGIGFLGAIVAGLAAGYLVLLLKRISLPRSLQGINVILFIPFVTTVVLGLALVYVVGTPIGWVTDKLTTYLANINTGSAIVLGAVMGLMTAFDMGGPMDKIAYTFSVGLLAEGITAPMAANMAAGMTPALGLGVATFIFKNKFTESEREAGKTAIPLGACFITEGAIPFAAADPLRVLPATMLGAATTGGLSMLFGCTLAAPHGGVFAIAIPGVVGHVGLYIASIVIGTIVTAVAVACTKSIAPRAITRVETVSIPT